MATTTTGSVLTRLIQDHSTAMTQTIDGVCLPLRGGRHVAREEHARQAAWLFLFFPYLGGPPPRLAAEGPTTDVLNIAQTA